MGEPRRRYAPNIESQPEDEEALLSSANVRKASQWTSRRKTEREEVEGDFAIPILLGLLMGLGVVVMLAYWLM